MKIICISLFLLIGGLSISWANSVKPIPALQIIKTKNAKVKHTYLPGDLLIVKTRHKNGKVRGSLSIYNDSLIKVSEAVIHLRDIRSIRDYESQNIWKDIPLEVINQSLGYGTFLLLARWIFPASFKPAYWLLAAAYIGAGVLISLIQIALGIRRIGKRHYLRASS